MPGRERRASFYYEVQPFRGTINRDMLFYAGILFGSSVFVILLMLFSAVIYDSVADNVTEQRFSRCQRQNCRGDEPVAVVIPFHDDQLDAVARLIQDMMKETTPSNYSKSLDIIFLRVNPADEFTSQVSRLNGILDQIGTVFGKAVITKLDGHYSSDSEVLNNLFSSDAPEFVKQYCFIYFSSIDMHILKANWPQFIVEHSSMAADKHFWIKSPLDMSLHPFSYYEQIEISLYSIYAVQSNCLQELFLLAEEVYPSVSISKAFNNFLRDPSQLILSHRIASKLQISAFGVDVRNTEVSVEKLKAMFPDAAIAQGTQIR